MGKNGKKKLKEPIQYKLPPEKFLFVENPWGNPRSTAFANNVGGWFRIMLDGEYPDTCINGIFTQNTHDDIIVELPEHVDISQYLGAHRFANILKPPYNESKQVACIYEYNYRRHNDPNKQWTLRIPSIAQYPPPYFPVKDPYPAPSPGWNSTNKFALPLPGIPLLPLTKPIPNLSSIDPLSAFPPPTLPESSATQAQPGHINHEAQEASLFTPYSPPSHFPVGPLHPEDLENEEDETHMALLDDHAEFKQEEEDTKPNLLVDKRDPYEEEDTARRVVAGRDIKQESEDIRLDQYQPSQELLASFSALPPHLLNSESQSFNIKAEAANENFTSQWPMRDDAQEHIPEGSSRPLHKDSSITVKQEPDDTSFGNTASNYQPSEELLACFSQLPPNVLNPPQSSIKVENEDDILMPSPWQQRASHSEPSDGLAAQSINSRDPRIRAKAIGSLKRPKIEDNVDYERTRRIKWE